MTEQKHSACPFCGGEVDPTGWLRGDGLRGPECDGCGATAPSMEVWERRSNLADQIGNYPIGKGFLQEFFSAMKSSARTPEVKELIETAAGVVGALQRQVEGLAALAQPSPSPTGPNYKFKFETLVEHCKRQDQVISELRYDENIRRFYDEGAVWFWCGDETDNLETLACPVVINAGDLRAMLAATPVAQAGQVPEALREGFMTSCSGNGKYEVKIQFSNLPAAQESHNFLVKLIASSVQGGA